MKKLFILTFIVFTASILNAQEEPTGPAYAVTWQNENGYWFAVGPVQALWAGEETEEMALNYVIGSEAKKAKKIEKVKTCGKFTVYKLGIDYESYDLDAMKYVRKNGYECDEPK